MPTEPVHHTGQPVDLADQEQQDGPDPLSPSSETRPAVRQYENKRQDVVLGNQPFAGLTVPDTRIQKQSCGSGDSCSVWNGAERDTAGH